LLHHDLDRALQLQVATGNICCCEGRHRPPGVCRVRVSD
jgi:hypothetical protein